MCDTESVRAEIRNVIAKLQHLEARLIELDPAAKLPQLHALCYKCAVATKEKATQYRITKHSSRLFSVDEYVGKEWRQLTRRTTQEAANNALLETQAFRKRRDERQCRLARKLRTTGPTSQPSPVCPASAHN